MNAQVQDPSFLVHNQLLPHLHLTSTYQFPLMQRMGLEQVLNYLLQAPQIAKEMKPMAWTYLSPPQDGTMFLTWQAPRMGSNFASDGIVWTDMEGTFRQQVRGYELEILVHRAGYIFQHEPVAAHQRIRYHIVNREANLPPTDPSFWLVHYSPADPQNRIPVAQLPIHPQVQKSMQERLFLEQQGGILQRKEFMLMDRANWPTVNTNSRMQAPPAHPAYQPSPMMVRQQPQHYAQPPVQPPVAKRQKIERGVAQVIQENKISDAIFEEDVEFGDYFDTLTPAEISRMRFKQHHEWMEEIYSSVYSLSQIIPEDMGFGLTGSLKELTDGIFPAPDPYQVVTPLEADRNDRNGTAKPVTGSKAYEKLSPKNMEEFERRIAQYEEKAKAEIQAMKKQHADAVAHFNKSKTYMKAERKLKDGDVDAVVQEVENTLSARIVEQRSKVCFEEGGLEKEDKSRAVNGSAAADGSTSSNDYNGNGFGAADNSAAGLLDEFGTSSFTNSPAARIPTPAISRPQSTAPTPGATAAASPTQSLAQQGQSVSEPTAPVPEDESGMDLLEGMDLDVDIDALGEGEGESKSGAEDEWVMVGDSAQAAPPPPQAPPTSTSTEAVKAEPESAAPPSAPTSATTAIASKPIPSAVLAPATATEHVTSMDTPNATADMFDAGDFGNTFDDLDTAGDALADFDAGEHDDLGMDLGGDGEFGDAFGTPGQNQEEGGAAS